MTAWKEGDFRGFLVWSFEFRAFELASDLGFPFSTFDSLVSHNRDRPSRIPFVTGRLKRGADIPVLPLLLLFVFTVKRDSSAPTRGSRQNDRKMVDRNIEEASDRIGPRFFIFLSSIFLSYLQRTIQTRVLSL